MPTTSGVKAVDELVAQLPEDRRREVWIAVAKAARR
jgi:hypothetical protein